MSGLEKITNHILEDAKAQYSHQLGIAQDYCDSLLSDAENEALKTYELIISKAKADALLEKERKISIAKSKFKNDLLEIKVSSVKAVLESSKKAIINSNDEVYNQFFNAVLKGCSLKKGKLFINSKSLKRLNKTNQSLINTYTVNKDDSLNDGFLITEGTVTENYLIDDIFETKKDELWDLVSSILFI